MPPPCVHVVGICLVYVDMWSCNALYFILCSKGPLVIKAPPNESAAGNFTYTVTVFRFNTTAQSAERIFKQTELLFSDFPYTVESLEGGHFDVRIDRVDPSGVVQTVVVTSATYGAIVGKSILA